MRHDLVFMSGIEEGFPLIDRLVIEHNSDDSESILNLFKEFCFLRGIDVEDSDEYYANRVEKTH